MPHSTDFFPTPLLQSAANFSRLKYGRRSGSEAGTGKRKRDFGTLGRNRLPDFVARRCDTLLVMERFQEEDATLRVEAQAFPLIFEPSGA
jgi:hypothetical protein